MTDHGMRIFDTQYGERYIEGLSERDRQTVGSYWNAVNDLLDGKDTDTLRRFEGARGTIGGYGNVPVCHLVADPHVIYRYQLRSSSTGYECSDEPGSG